MPIQIRKGRLYQMPMRTRMPFRYGMVSLTELSHLFLQLRVVVDGITYTGIAADHLAPKWFTKNPETTPDEDITEIAGVIRQALVFAEGMEAETPFDLWQTLYRRQSDWGMTNALAPLLTNFGVSLVERAMLEAFCRAKGKPFAALLHENAFGIRLSAVHPELGEAVPADFLPAAPLPAVLARHTVGMADPLTEAEITEENRLRDGLPQSLEAAIRAYGLRHFKLKIGGVVEGDSDRITAVLETIAAHASDLNWRYTLDGNESYTSVGQVKEFWERLTAGGMGREAREHLLFIEQPLHRDIALSPEIRSEFAAWPWRPPFIIDESDGSLTDFPAALDLGYAGTSHKNCKGVFKGIANTCLARKRGALLSGEDLSTVGPVSLLQDLAAQAALGIESVERNGQHYFAGLSMFPADVRQAILAAHPDLYHASPQGFPTVAIRRGEIELDTVNAAPFGLAANFDPATAAGITEV